MSWALLHSAVNIFKVTRNTYNKPAEVREAIVHMFIIEFFTVGSQSSCSLYGRFPILGKYRLMLKTP